jgi:hypothetical protein
LSPPSLERKEMVEELPELPRGLLYPAVNIAEKAVWRGSLCSVDAELWNWDPL